MNPNPAAAENNLHHTLAYRSEQEWLEDLLGRGPGDPDMSGYYPGEPNYPLLPTDAILVDNGVTTISGEVPF